MEVLSYELARQTGVEKRSVRLALHDDGSIRLDGQDIGPRVKAIWGDDDYEFGVTIPPAAVGRLAVELLRYRYAENLDAVDAVRDFCTRYGIDHQFDSWA